jgi:WD40 repeat protein
MASSHTALGWFLLLLLAAPAPARAPFVPPGDPDPILQVDAGGPRSRINALAFGVTGKALNLYEAGFDKVIRVWAADKGVFRLTKTYRIPIGPESEGLINTLALSPDGRWLAVGGRSVRRDSVKFGAEGIVVPDVALAPEVVLDEGTIYVFDTAAGRFHTALRGHRGSVAALAFARTGGDKATLVSVGRELRDGKRQTAVLVWDLDKPEVPAKKTLIDSDIWVDATSIPPGLAVYRSADAGDSPVSGLRVAVAYRNGQLYHWNAETGELAEARDDRRYTETAVFSEDGTLYTGGVVTGGVAKGGKIDRWRLNGKLSRVQRFHVADRHLPQALAFLPGEKDSAGKIAVVLQPSRVETHYQLAILSLDSGKPERTFDLWARGEDEDEAVRQVVAASPDGRFLAVSDNVTAAIRTWDTTNWDAKFEPLRGVGDSMTTVAFVRRGDHRGLRLRPAGSRDEERVFDIDDHRLLADTRGWKDDGPDSEGWDVKADVKNRTFLVQGGDEEPRRIRLGPNQKPTAWAVLPGRATLPALLAVAYEERGIAYLALYTAQRWKKLPPGQLVRLLVGHQGRIRSVAFAADGQALASAGDDQTVSVWSLKDLPDHLGMHAELRGFRCLEKDNTLRYLAPAPTLLSETNREALSGIEGDSVIEEAVAGARKKRLRSMKDFGDILWTTKPGTALTLRIAGRAVELTTDQGVDLRMPLFSLFFMQGAADGQKWVGWSPAGSFDVGNREGIEKYLAWHLNTGKPDNPADKVSLDKERKDYYRPAILHFLLKTGDHASAVQEWKDTPPKDRPGMTLVPTGPDIDWKLKDADGHLLLRKPPTGLEAALGGDFPLNRIARVLWQLDNEEPQPFSGTTPADLRAAFGRRVWNRGVHTLRLLVQLNNSAGTIYHSDDFADPFTFRYALPPPVAALSVPVTETERDAVEVSYSFGPGPGSEKVGVTGKLLHTWWDGDRAQKKEHPLASASEKAFPVTLHTGRNLFQFEAVNDAPLGDSYPSGTTTTQLQTITLTPKPSPVTIALTGIRSREQELKLPGDGKELIVSTPFVFISGKAEAKDGLEDVAIDGETPGGFKVGGERFVFDRQPIDLRGHRGKARIIRVTARTKRAQAEPLTLTLKYLPALPGFRLTSPQKIEPSRSGSHVLVGAFEPPEDLQPFSFTLRVNDAALKRIAAADSLARTAVPLEVEVKLQPGDNTVAVELQNEWLPAVVKTLPTVYVRRLPQVVEVKAPDKLKTPFVDVQALVRSFKGLPVTGAVIEVRWGADRKEDHLIDSRDIERQEGDNWLVSADKIQFGKGATQIAVYASNADGQSLEPAVKDIAFAEPLPDRPRITIQQPARSRLQTRPPYLLAFTVTTPAEEALKKVEVSVNGKAVADLRNLKHPREGDPTNFETEVPFAKGTNKVKIVAGNAGGDTILSTDFVVEPPPVALDPESFRLERFVAEDRKEEVQRLRLEQGKPIFRNAGSGLVVFSGAFHWDAAEANREKDELVRVSVNGHEQAGGRLGRPIDKRRRFELSLRLNRKKANLIQVRFPGPLKTEPLEFTIDCVEPVFDQRLLLLVLAPGYRQPEKLRQQVARGFLAREVKSDGSFQTPAFREAQVIGPDRPNFDFGEVNAAVHELERLANQSAEKFREPTPEKPYNDVIVVYFRGEDRIIGGKHYLLTEEARRAEKAGDIEEMKRAAVDCNDLRDQLAGVKGAKILVLDIQGRKVLDIAGNIDPTKNIGAADGVAVVEWLDGRKKTPQEDLLLRMWERSLSQTELFKEVRLAVQEEARGLRDEEKKGVLYAEYVPAVLDALVLGRKGLPRP